MCRTDKTSFDDKKKSKKKKSMLRAVGRRDAEELAHASADSELKGDYGNGHGDVSDVTVKDKPRHVELRELFWHV